MEPHLGREHEVKLAHVGPVAGTAQGAGNFIVENDLPQLGQVVFVHGLGKTGVQLLAFGDVLLHAGIGLTEEGFVEAVAKTFGSILILFLHLLCPSWLSGLR